MMIQRLIANDKADNLRANRFMNQDDVLVCLSLAWFVALSGAAIWVLFWPANNIFGL